LNTKQTTDTFWAVGHANIHAIHPTTLMFTKDIHVSQKGDCIVAVTADKSVADLSVQFKEELRKPKAKLTVFIEAGDLIEEIKALGSPKLCLCHPTDIVIRKSDYICSRTLAICADKASNNLSRDLVEKLQDPKQKVKITLRVES
jgi:uncharacterized protein